MSDARGDEAVQDAARALFLGAPLPSAVFSRTPGITTLSPSPISD